MSLKQKKKQRWWEITSKFNNGERSEKEAFFFFAQHENQLAPLNNFVLNCQERRAAEVKLSARQERKKGGKVLGWRPE